MRILAIETSADETAAAVLEGRKVLSNVIYSQIEMHSKWGGIYPALAKRAHEEKIDPVINEALNVILGRSKATTSESDSGPIKISENFQGKQARMTLAINKIDYIAVTYGPGLAIALEVGIKKAKELAMKYNKKIISVNHLEGHIYSNFVQNSKGNPFREFEFPYLAFIISGGHTEIVLFKNHCLYEVLGETKDDAAGEALDKAAKMFDLGYPGGPVIERLALEVGNQDLYHFPRPMLKSKDLHFSFSGLKTSLFYFLKNLDEKEKIKQLKPLCSAYQEAVFDTLEQKLEMAIEQTGINQIVVGGGVSANLYFRKKLKKLLAKHKGYVLFPPFKYLTGDNAVMIGVAAYYKAQKGMFVNDIEKLDRVPRLSLSHP